MRMRFYSQLLEALPDIVVDSRSAINQQQGMICHRTTPISIRPKSSINGNPFIVNELFSR